MQMKTQDIKPETLARLEAVAKKSENADTVLNRMINTVLGFDCPHLDFTVYMEIAHDKDGYMDLDETLKGLTDIRNGVPTRKMIRICKACLRGTEIIEV